MSHSVNSPQASPAKYKREEQLTYEEGKSPAAWTGSLTALAGFIIILVGVLLGPIMVICYLGAALVVIAGILTLVLKSRGYGTLPR